MRWEGSWGWAVYRLGDQGGGFCFKDNVTQKATCRVLNREVTCDRSLWIHLERQEVIAALRENGSWTGEMVVEAMRNVRCGLWFVSRDESLVMAWKCDIQKSEQSRAG